MGVLPTKSKSVADPLYAHGFVLQGGQKPVVLCALDWCEIRNGAFEQWKTALAKAAGTSPEYVLITALHQHDAPVVDLDAQNLLDKVGLENELYQVNWHDQTLARVAQAVKDSLELTSPVTHYGTSDIKVDRIASNRRVILENGGVTYSRGSRSGGNEYMANAPEGDIDPMLKTITFFNHDKVLLQLHHYATHPMSYYGQGVVSADFVGLARDRLQRENQSIRQIFVPGCGGDVTAGKYNNGSEEHRQELINKLYQAMAAASKNTVKHKLTNINFRNTALVLPFHPGAHLTRKQLSEDLENDGLSTEKRILAAMGLASRNRVEANKPLDFPCVDLGNAQIVLFPGETFIGYQLIAQQYAGNNFVMCIAYGDAWTGYLPTDATFEENFTDSWLWVGKGSEKKIREAIKKVIRK
ncbi:MAG: hypothetical protein CMJ76_12035 [Planctomycetaceae bacterium]|nr:hypothetical protein [Planctomycetaceae bacterium]